MCYFHNYTEKIDGNDYDLKNVICKKTVLTTNTILICAHYDSRIKNIDDSDSRSPGANDNASGVSAILEVARILHEQNLEFNITVCIIFR